jgi:hypothetical protein
MTMGTARMKRWSSRLGLGTLCLSSFGAIYLGACGDDDPAPVTPTEAGTDSSTDPPDTGGGGGDSAPDVKICTDTPFDCSATSADAGIEDAGSTNTQGAAGTVPYNLRCTQLYSCWSDKTVNSATHREYVPAFQLWSDGAEKTRWMVIPAGGTIDTGDPTTADKDGGTADDWVYPVGTMVYKEFKLGGKRIETRRIWKAAEGEWVYSVWRWSADESTATLMNKGEVIANTTNATAKKYEIPANTACAACHDGHRDKFLSLDAWSLAAGSTGVTLAMLKAEGKLPKWNAPTSFAVPQDPTGKFDKAVGFYYNNCGFCHKPGRPGAGTGLQLYLPVAPALPGNGSGVPTGLPDGGAGLVHTETPVYKTAVDVAHSNAVGGLYPLGTWKRITKGNVGLSVLPARDSLRDGDGGIINGQMPNILSRVADPNGVERTKEWINALPP